MIDLRSFASFKRIDPLRPGPDGVAVVHFCEALTGRAIEAGEVVVMHNDRASAIHVDDWINVVVRPRLVGPARITKQVCDRGVAATRRQEHAAE